MEFIYLMPGNWFELKMINSEKTSPYDAEMLQAEILNQVNSRSDKLSFINLTFGSRYKKFQIDEIKFYLNNEKFNKIATLLKSETRHPIITFHGTNPTAINSILTTGYIIPGLDNTAIKVAHGSMYGTGVYTSPFFDKAMNYTAVDNCKYVYLLINLVFLGKMKLIPQATVHIDFKAPVNGVYSDGSNTRIVYGLEQLISADSTRVVPIAVMKINIA